MNTSRPGDMAVDLGKTSCRVRLLTRGGRVEASTAGFEGFARGDDGVRQALDAVTAALSQLPGGAGATIRRVGVGAAGVDADRGHARRFATALRDRWHAEIAVASDAIAAHAGALGGACGTVLIVGTGAVAYRVSSEGMLARADGWGIWLGDLGSGRWIGQEGLRRVLRAGDRLAPATSLSDPARRLAGDLSALPRYVSGGGHPERVLAAFAPVVLEHAAAGDDVASAIVAEAVQHLTETACACAMPDDGLSVVGGLMRSTFLNTRLTAALTRRGLHPTAPVGDALDGALLICATPEIPHERFTIRVRY